MSVDVASGNAIRNVKHIFETMKPIRIMHVVRTLATGGMETVVRRLVSRLDPDRFQQSVCTLVAADAAQPPHTICLERSPDEAAFLVPQLMRVFRRERPDIVHSRNWATIEAPVAARLARIRGIVHSEHGRDLNTIGPQPWRRRLLRKISYSCADRLFAVSQELKDYYCAQLSMKASAFSVIHNGVDVEHFRPDPQTRSAMRAKLGVTPGTLVVGSVGRLDPIKDHVSLLRAADAAVSNAVDLRLVIVGNGPQRPILEKELAQRPVLARRTVLAGEVSNVTDWLNSFDIFALPSLSEGMSNTLLEAMASGVAPIATAVGGNCEVIENGRSGMLVPAGDVNSLCHALLQLSAAKEKRGELGGNARQHVISNFSIDRMLKRYEEMYIDLAKSKSVRWASFRRNQSEAYVRHLRNS
jgi:sugar transferase (PEP-CTERM/EpsH1 system associated)